MYVFPFRFVDVLLQDLYLLEPVHTAWNNSCTFLAYHTVKGVGWRGKNTSLFGIWNCSRISRIPFLRTIYWYQHQAVFQERHEWQNHGVDNGQDKTKATIYCIWLWHNIFSRLSLIRKTPNWRQISFKSSDDEGTKVPFLANSYAHLQYLQYGMYTSLQLL